MIRTELLVIGAGPGGMAAGLAGAGLGLKTLVLDEQPHPGGQIYRLPLEGLRDSLQGRELRSDFQASRELLTRLPDTVVWGIFPDRTVGLTRQGKTHRVSFEKLIIASGAHDRPVPFPGWTLPGVITAGGAQRLVKTMGTLPGQRILLAGSGPLQIGLAAQILKAGGRVVGVLEAGRVGNPLPALAGLPGNLDLLVELGGYLAVLARGRILPRTGQMIVEARGRDRVEEAVTARVDPDWRPIPGTRRAIPVDTICLGYGLVPSAELTLLAGCEHRYSPELGGTVPVRGDDLQTSRPHILAVGDGAGIMGRQVALLEGRIAALSAARQLGRISPIEERDRSAPLRILRQRRLRLKAALDRISTPRPGLFELADAETIICRCEGVTKGQLEEAEGGSVNDLKRLTRCGMGRCQGRICGSWLEGALGLEPFSRRPPLKPIALGDLAATGEDDHAA